MFWKERLFAPASTGARKISTTLPRLTPQLQFFGQYPRHVFSETLECNTQQDLWLPNFWPPASCCVNLDLPSSGLGASRGC